jgi:hypothetical protein
VLIGRRAALAAPFGQMRQELDAALGRIHDPQATGGARDRSLHQAGSPRPAKPRRQPRQKPHHA